MITPRPYQSEALESLNNHIWNKQTNPCVVIPTGGGKSILMAWAIQKWKEQYPPFRAIILAHRKELVDQNAEELSSIFPDGDIGIYSASLKKRDIENDIIYASIDSVYDKWGKFGLFNVIIVDESHRIPANGEGKYRQFIAGCKKNNPKIRIIGFTATPYRTNCGPICHKDHILNEICYEANVADLINQGYLCKLRSKIGDVDIDISNVKKNSGGDYITKSLAEAVDTPELVQKAVESAVKCIIQEKRQSIMFFCVDIKHCSDVHSELLKYGIDAPMVTGKTSINERDRIADQFKSGKIHAICNVNVYTEGFNAKRVDCIVIFRPTLSSGLYYQMVGRGLRLHPGKSDCIVLDYGHCIESHGPIDCIDGGDIRIVKCQDCGDSFSRVIRICPNCGWEIPKKQVEKMEAEDKVRKMHEEEATKLSILSQEPQEFKVDGVTVHRHKKDGKPDSIRVQYRCGLNVFREWVCLDHYGDTGTQAKQWWARRFGADSANEISVDKALNNMYMADEIKEVTESITVLQKGKFTEITNCKIKNLRSCNND